MILSYELVDDPGHEHEEEVETQFDACYRLLAIEEFCLWWELSDSDGHLVMGSN
ncbi:hypothetical protein D9M69_454040 [compost metagenome]